jgi:hypothetical protein
MKDPLKWWSWLSSTQNWFNRTERSSGFRAFLIFIILHICFAAAATRVLGATSPVSDVLTRLLWVTLPSFVILYFIKAICDPDFCRSEKHLENKLKIQYAEQAGDEAPTILIEDTQPSLGAQLNQPRLKQSSDTE